MLQQAISLQITSTQRDFKKSLFDLSFMSNFGYTLAMDIQFKRMTIQDLPYWEKWAKQSFVSEIWFPEESQTADYVIHKIMGNGYDHPFIILCDRNPIGFIQCSDLYAYRTLCLSPKGVFTQEKPGTFGMDLFIGEEHFLNKGYGSRIVNLFAQKIFSEFNAKVIYIDPFLDNKRAIRCDEEAGFEFTHIAHHGENGCYIMQCRPHGAEDN